MRYHPMWFIIFFIFGMAYYNLTLDLYVMGISWFFGLLFTFLAKSTPSEVSSFKKNPTQTIIVWILVITTALIMFIDVFAILEW